MHREESLAQTVVRLEKELAAMKTRQRVYRGVLPTYETTRTGESDFTWSTPINPNDVIVRWYKFVADNIDEPLVKLVVDLKDVTSGTHTDRDKVDINIQDQTQLSGLGAKVKVFKLEIGARHWNIMSPSTPITDSIRVKGYAYANDTGTLTYHTSMPT